MTAHTEWSGRNGELRQQTCLSPENGSMEEIGPNPQSFNTFNVATLIHSLSDLAPASGATSLIVLQISEKQPRAKDLQFIVLLLHLRFSMMAQKEPSEWGTTVPLLLSFLCHTS